MSKLPSRKLTPFIVKDLKHKMVFLAGPRQVGKTTLAQSLISKFKDEHPAYLNWDNSDHRTTILTRSWPRNEKLIVFDEIHKHKSWQNLIKGTYDTLKNTHSFLITGSARLDIFRKGGDSLMGRYHLFRLHPYTLPELEYKKGATQALFQFGGFPEPLAFSDPVQLKRWHRQRLSHLIRIDLRDLEEIKQLDKIELLASDLHRRVGAPLSLRSLALQLECDPKTIQNWVSILDRLYFSFRISPYGAPKIKAVKKEQKLYLWDWSQIVDPGARFENMLASHLLKFCHYHEDIYGEQMELRYLRDDRGREVDFVVLKNNRPMFAVEAKLNDTSFSENLFYFSERTPISKFYQVHQGTENKSASDSVCLIGFQDFCKEVQLV